MKKFDPEQVIYLTFKVFGGQTGPAATLAPKLGPLGLNARVVGEQILRQTSKWKGIRVKVQLKVQNRKAEVTILPTTSALIIKELGNFERDRKKVKNVSHKGNLTMDQIKKIAKVMEEKSMAKQFEGTVTEVIGTCVSMGVTVDKMKGKEVIQKIKNKEIKV